VEDWATLAERETLERVSRVEAKNTTALASAREDAERFARKITLLEDELVAERQAQEVSERECREHFKKLILLQTQGSKQCHAIIAPPRARHHLPEGMRFATLRNTEMAGELVVLHATVSSAAESMLGHSPSDTFCVEVLGELAAEFQKMEDRCSRLEWPVMRICDLLLGPPIGWARLVDRLDEATRQLRVELATRWEANAELEALRTSAV
jgi:hypothetical protein